MIIAGVRTENVLDEIESRENYCNFHRDIAVALRISRGYNQLDWKDF